MKTLLISSQMPWPLDAGSKIRTYNLLRCYAEIGEVTLVCFSQENLDLSSFPLAEQLSIRVICLQFCTTVRVETTAEKRYEYLLRLMKARPWMVQYFKSVEISGLIKALVEKENYDILHVERLYMIQNVEHIFVSRKTKKHTYWVIDVDDIESKKMFRIAALESWRSSRKYTRLIECIKLYVYEMLMIPKFDCALVCSEVDRLCIKKRFRSIKSVTFSNGTDIRNVNITHRGRDNGQTLLFFGAMGYQPNEDAAIYFTQFIFPLITQKCSKVQLIIAGRSPSERIRQLNNHHNVVVTGYVQNKSELYRSCTVFIVPIRIAGGTRIKILEAMAEGKPVVSTTVGCEGINVKHNVNIMIADSPEDFSNACLALFDNEARRYELGLAGRELVTRLYQWNKIRKNYISSVKKTLLKNRIDKEKMKLI